MGVCGTGSTLKSGLGVSRPEHHPLRTNGEHLYPVLQLPWLISTIQEIVEFKLIALVNFYN